MVMPTLVHRLIAAERHNDADAGSNAAFRVCERLRAPLCTFAGTAGFRSLMSRALVLAKADAPLLGGVQIKPDGTFLYSPELTAQLASAEAAKAGAALVSQLIELLVTFIGEALTLGHASK